MLDVQRFLSDPVYFEQQLDEIQLEAEMRKMEGLIPVVDQGDGPSGFISTHKAKRGVKSDRVDKRKRAKAARKRNR